MCITSAPVCSVTELGFEQAMNFVKQ